MSNRQRVILFIVGLLLLCCACVALSYSFWPLDSQSVQGTLPPTLMIPP